MSVLVLFIGAIFGIGAVYAWEEKKNWLFWLCFIPFIIAFMIFLILYPLDK